MRRLIPAMTVLLALLAGDGAARAADKDWTVIQRGLYLVRAGDCAACHTVPGQASLSGGYPVQTPFGTIYSANLTPDQQTGLGTWNEADFHRAMAEGRSKDGTRLYPAFPYTHFTHVTREDTDAIFAYLGTLAPAHNRVPRPELVWPLNWRFLMAGWNLLNFEREAFAPDPGKSPEYNRGKYLVEGLMHCGMCHSPKNLIGAEDRDEAGRFSGGMAEGWWAPPLKANDREGIGRWSREDIVQFLKYGRNERSIAFGPMAQVVRHSTHYMTEDDLAAVAAYLKEMPGSTTGGDEAEAASLSDDEKRLGALIFNTQCAACHKRDGSGVAHMLPPLAHSSFAQADNATSVIRLILEGGEAATTDKYPTPHRMPAFGWKLTDREVAAVANYVRNSFGNRAPTVSTDDVADLRTADRPGGGP